MYFARIIHLAHEAVEHAYWSLGWPIERQFEELGCGMPIVNCEASFRSPLRMGDEVSVALRSREVRPTTVELEVRIDKAETCAAKIQLKLCCVAKEGFKSTPLPAPLRLVFQAFAPNP